MSDTIPHWDYEGKVEFVFSGYEGYTTAYIDGEDLAEMLAAHFAKEFYDEDYWQASGQLKISVELVAPFAAPPPRPTSRRAPEPACNCVHVNAPDDHLPYCATWGGKRLPGSEKM